jgi:L-rhamnose mutarotase
MLGKTKIHTGFMEMKAKEQAKPALEIVNSTDVSPLASAPAEDITGSLERMAWRGKIKTSRKAEYIRRHDEIWPEMAEALKNAGISNYTIFCSGYDLFGYYECEKGIAYAEKAQAGSPIVDKWNKYMQDVLELEMDAKTGAQPKLETVFRLD